MRFSVTHDAHYLPAGICAGCWPKRLVARVGAHIDLTEVGAGCTILLRLIEFAAAGLISAQRASRIDPILALRAE